MTSCPDLVFSHFFAYPAYGTSDVMTINREPGLAKKINWDPGLGQKLVGTQDLSFNWELVLAKKINRELGLKPV